MSLCVCLQWVSEASLLHHPFQLKAKIKILQRVCVCAFVLICARYSPLPGAGASLDISAFIRDMCWFVKKGGSSSLASLVTYVMVFDWGKPKVRQGGIVAKLASIAQNREAVSCNQMQTSIRACLIITWINVPGLSGGSCLPCTSPCILLLLLWQMQTGKRKKPNPPPHPPPLLCLRVLH